MGNQNIDNFEGFLTQKEVANRWRVTESTVKNLRDRGELPFFNIPKSTRILYPLKEILKIEQIHTNKKEVVAKKNSPKIERERTVISTKSNKKWEI